jgi:hypothetical protein
VRGSYETVTTLVPNVLAFRWITRLGGAGVLLPASVLLVVLLPRQFLRRWWVWVIVMIVVSTPVDPSEAAEVIDTDRFHHTCRVRLTTQERIHVSRALGRRSHELILKSRELLGLEPMEVREP